MALQHLNKDTFDEAVKSGVALIDFWAEWCGPCQMLGPVIEGLAEKYEGKALVAKVNVDENRELAMRYRVMSIPTVVLLKDGAEIERKIGLMPEEAYGELLDQNL